MHYPCDVDWPTVANFMIFGATSLSAWGTISAWKAMVRIEAERNSDQNLDRASRILAWSQAQSQMLRFQNSGSQAVFAVVVHWSIQKDEKDPPSDQLAEVPSIPPHSMFEVVHATWTVPMSIGIYFRDSGNRHWYRAPSGAVMSLTAADRDKRVIQLKARVKPEREWTVSQVHADTHRVASNDPCSTVDESVAVDAAAWQVRFAGP